MRVKSILSITFIFLLIISAIPVQAGWTEDFTDGSEWTIIGTTHAIVDGVLKAITMPRNGNEIAKRYAEDWEGEFNLTWYWKPTDHTDSAGPHWIFGAYGSNITDSTLDTYNSVNRINARLYYTASGTQFNLEYRYGTNATGNYAVIADSDLLGYWWVVNLHRTINANNTAKLDMRFWKYSVESYNTPTLRAVYDGIPIFPISQILSCNLNTGTSGYYWSGEIDDVIYETVESPPESTDPHITSTAVTDAYVGYQYEYNVTSTAPDNGGIQWYYSLPTWLSVVEGGNGYQYLKLQGTPSTAGSYDVQIEVYDADSEDWQNFTINVVDAGIWGEIHTLDDVADGTRDGDVIQFTNGDQLTLIDSSANDEMVVMGGELYYFAKDDTSGTVARYTPVPKSPGWNISMELYPFRDDDYLNAEGVDCSRYEMIVNLMDGTTKKLAVKFAVGEPSEGYDDIEVYDGSSWTQVHTDIITSTPNRQGGYVPEYGSDNIYGLKFDRYILSFEQTGSQIKITIIEMVHPDFTVIHCESYDIGSQISSPEIEFEVATTHKYISSYRIMNYWVIDNIGIREKTVPYLYADPRYEYVIKENSIWLTVCDELGNTISSGVTVAIGGSGASYNSTSGRYEGVATSTVDWYHPYGYSIRFEDCYLNGTLYVTTVPQADGVASVSNWWNGWDWVSVFGMDDCSSPSDAINCYSAYNHPTVPYIWSSPSGSSSDIDATQSEIGNHYPHDYAGMGYKLWSEAQSWASSAYSNLANYFTYASIWDDPAYVGQGDTYLMTAFPGNWANMQIMHALMEYGYRISGRASDAISPNNKILWSAWYSVDWVINPESWYPYEPLQMMDIFRYPDVENALSEVTWDWIFNTSEYGGVVSIYTHGSISSSGAVLLSWIDNEKTNWTYENWKATNGEVASYIFGRWTTDVAYNQSASSQSARVYDISRIDPISRGYWRVPVTVAVNLTGITLDYVSVVEGSDTYNSSDGSLKNLSGARIMDVGYDIRDGYLYVSHFWNSSSKLIIGIAELNVAPDAPALVSPNNGASISNDTVITFSWSFSDPDADDYQSAYQLQISTSSTFSSIYYDSGKVLSSSSSMQYGPIESTGTYYWRVKVWDSSDLASGWSSSRSFTITASTIQISSYLVDLEHQTLRVYVTYSGGSPAHGIVVTYMGVNKLTNQDGWASISFELVNTIPYNSIARANEAEMPIPIAKRTVNVFNIIARGDIFSTEWNDTDQYLSFQTNGSEIVVKVWDYGTPQSVELNGETYTSWIYDSILNLVRIDNSQNAVSVIFKLIWGSSTGDGSVPPSGGGGGDIPDDDTPPDESPPEEDDRDDNDTNETAGGGGGGGFWSPDVFDVEINDVQDASRVVMIGLMVILSVMVVSRVFQRRRN